VTLGGRVIELDGVGYHDHNWGHFRDAVWDWGIVHAGEFSVLYGRFANSADALAREPVLFALFDAKGPRPFVLTHDYNVLWKPAGAARTLPPPKTRITLDAAADSAAADSAGAGVTDVPATVVLHAKSGADELELHIEVERHFVSETGGGEQPLFRADEHGRSFFVQMEGRVRITGTLDGARIEVKGHAYAETFRVEG
jgi:hypothetical protein